MAFLIKGKTVFIRGASIKSGHVHSLQLLEFNLLKVFSCPGSSIPDLGQWVGGWVTATLEFWHKEWLLRLETLQTFDQSVVKTKRQKDKKTKRQKDKKTKTKQWVQSRDVRAVSHSCDVLPDYSNTHFVALLYGRVVLCDGCLTDTYICSASWLWPIFYAPSRLSTPHWAHCTLFHLIFVLSALFCEVLVLKLNHYSLNCIHCSQLISRCTLCWLGYFTQTKGIFAVCISKSSALQ